MSMFWYGVWWEEEYQYYEDGLLDAHFCLVFFFFKQDLFEQKKRRALQKIITLG